MENFTGVFFWGFLVVYGILMFVLSPKTVSLGGFFRGTDKMGREAKGWLITSSIFISWIFAKSVTNAADMGAQYGIVGGIGYAVYWLCIPLTGYALYRLRRKFAAKSLVSFITEHFGVVAAFCFSAAIFVRLFNEVWSNTSVVGAYYGTSGSAPFIIAALLFTAITIAYCCFGGMRGSLTTDVLQTIMFAVLLVFVLTWVLPHEGVAAVATSGSWTMEGGVDFILGAGLQCLSYGFHDAVLTDRGFICKPKKMLKCFIGAGLLGFVAILLFSCIGVYAYLNEMSIEGSSAPVVVAQSFGIVAMLCMAVIMMMTGGSTLDSCFTAIGKLAGKDLPDILGKTPKTSPRAIGIIVIIVFGIFGNIPMVMGATIISATTISGTMIMGLGPIFLAHGWVKPTKVGFFLAFWIGMIFGVVDTFWPQTLSFMNIGGGDYANFLGVNFYGAVICWAAYLIPGLIAQTIDAKHGIEPTWKGLSREELRALDEEERRRELAGEEDVDPEAVEPNRRLG